MEFALHARVVVKEAGLRQPIEALSVLIVFADIVGEGVAPRPHLRGNHSKVQRALVTLHCALKLVLTGNVLKAIDSTYDNVSRVSQGATSTRATQRFPSGLWTTASAPSKASPFRTARAMGVSSGGINSPSRLSSRKEPQKR
jgi:hypothetical protein